MKGVRFIAHLLVVIAALNYGMMGFFGKDVISGIFGGMDGSMTRIVFAIIGLAGLYSIKSLFSCIGCGCKCGSNCNCCKK